MTNDVSLKGLKSNMNIGHLLILLGVAACTYYSWYTFKVVTANFKYDPINPTQSVPSE